MGNRAHVIFTGQGTISPAVYLHWNGGPESVYAFLDELEAREGAGHDPSYAAARFCGVVADFFGPGGMSLGVVNGPTEITCKALEPFDHGDNGVYVVERMNGANGVRRFTGRFGQSVIEWTPEQVHRERCMARTEGMWAAILNGATFGQLCGNEVVPAP